MNKNNSNEMKGQKQMKKMIRANFQECKLLKTMRCYLFCITPRSGAKKNPMLKKRRGMSILVCCWSLLKLFVW